MKNRSYWSLPIPNCGRSRRRPLPIRLWMATAVGHTYSSEAGYASKAQRLDWILIIGRRHLERVMREWVEHYNQARPHRSLDLRTPIARSDPVVAITAVRCWSRLGGLLRQYSGAQGAAAA